MLSYADLGVSGIELVASKEIDHKEDQLPESASTSDLNPRGENPPRATKNGTPETEITLVHESKDSPEGIRIPLALESSGTRAWLSLIGRVLYALANGETLVVDEIDGSLHPLLSVTLVHIFKDPDLNETQAQIIFSTHDVSFLGNIISSNLLEPDEVWFTEKSNEGATTLYSLAEFKTRSDANIERGYLQGRFGATPHIGLKQIKATLSEIREEVTLHGKEAP
jgi:AAA15 family ATPase/GTPase